MQIADFVKAEMVAAVAVVVGNIVGVGARRVGVGDFESDSSLNFEWSVATGFEVELLARFEMIEVVVVVEKEKEKKFEVERLGVERLGKEVERLRVEGVDAVVGKVAAAVAFVEVVVIVAVVEVNRPAMIGNFGAD